MTCVSGRVMTIRGENTTRSTFLAIEFDFAEWANAVLNHVRSLLLGVRGSNSPGSDFPGEEPVPADFNPPPLTAALKSIRAILFGSNPDRLYLNYRLRQFMTILHSTELEEYVLALDKRTTYKIGEAKDLFIGKLGVKVEGSTRSIQFAGTFSVNDALGRARGQWRISINDGDTYTVFQESYPATTASGSFFVTDGVSSSIDLGGGLRCYVDPTPGNIWHVTANARPVRSLPDIVAALRQTPLTLHPGELFGQELVEPYLTFWNLWNQNDFLPYQLGGVLLAFAHRVDELTRG